MRWVVNCSDWLPELVWLGFDDLKEALGLSEHMHDGAFEFVWIERGRAAWEVGGESFETGAGDVFITKPDELHRGRSDIIEPCRLWWLILRANTKVAKEGDEASGWLQGETAELAALSAKLWSLPRIVDVGAEAGVLLRKLQAAVLRRGELDRLAAQTILLEFALMLVSSASVPMREQLEGVRSRIEDIVAMLATRLYDPPSVPMLAKEAGMSESHFFRLFQEHTGFTPRDYMSNLRIAEACRLLESTDRPVTEIAVDLGFATSQHFATVFKRMKLRSPTAWRQLNRARQLADSPAENKPTAQSDRQQRQHSDERSP